MVSPTVDANYAEAVAHYRQGRLPQAEAALKSALRLAPGNAHVLHLLGMIHQQQGDLSRALERLQQAVGAAPRNAEFLANLGNALREAGQLEKAVNACRQAILLKPDLAYAHNNLGNALLDLGQAGAAIEVLQRAITLQPTLSAAYANLGFALLQADRFEAAAAAFQKLLGQQPGYPPGYLGLGQAMQALGRLAEAEAAFARAIALHPAYAEAYCARANLRRAQGQNEAAAANFRTAIEQNPRLAIAWCGLGNLQAEQHRADEAIAAYLRAIELNPRLAEAHDNLGSLYAELGRTDDALAAARQLIRLFPARAEYWQRFADRLRGVRVAEPDGPLMAEIQRCLGVPGIDVEPLVPAALSLLAIAAPFAALLSATAEPAGDNEAGVLTPAAMTLLQHPLLLALLPRAPLVDLGFERLLTRARQTLLSLLISGGPDATGKPTLFALAAALAQQCFINEYVYPLRPKENDAVQALRDRLEQSTSLAARIGHFAAAVFACYMPLNRLAAIERLRPTSGDTHALWRTLWHQQIEEPAVEAEIQAQIPTLTESRDKVSLAVRRQYEENPYPRWSMTRSRPIRAAAAVLHDLLPDAILAADQPPANPDILIAGCGTGKQAVDAARRYPSARILAVDLSRPSLAYGIRKARDMGLSSIEFAVADIMELAAVELRFDVIECTGVLHHLRDPLAGWEILLSLLRPAGLMRVALYSATARRHVVAARTYLAQRGYPATASSMRRARQDLLALPDDHPASPVTRYADFFTLSECRDLLFHVQEHRFTLLQVEAMLAELGLEFLGFELGNPRVRAGRASFASPAEALSLAAWHAYEQAHPDCFQAMYQFWVRRRPDELAARPGRD